MQKEIIILIIGLVTFAIGCYMCYLVCACMIFFFFKVRNKRRPTDQNPLINNDIDPIDLEEDFSDSIN